METANVEAQQRYDRRYLFWRDHGPTIAARIVLALSVIALGAVLLAGHW